MRLDSISRTIENELLNDPEFSRSPSRIFSYTLAMSFFYNKTAKLDGHGHSHISDGVHTIPQIAKSVAHFTDSMVFLTDHNTIEHFPETIKLLLQLPDPDKGAIIVPGIEITCQINGIRCHVIIIGGKNDLAFYDFIQAQRKRYIEREVRRLRMINLITDINFKEEDYLKYCGPRTPNWTITFQYLSHLCKSDESPLELMRKAVHSKEDNEWWYTVPTLSEVYIFAQEQQALIFLCHLSDIAQNVGIDVISKTINEHPNLGIDYSASSTHVPIEPLSHQINSVLHRINKCPVLVGTDYHTTPPNPAPFGLNLKLSLSRALLDAAQIRYQSSASIMLHTGMYSMIFGTTQMTSHADVFYQMGQNSLYEWIDKYIENPIDEKRQMAETILALTLLKDIQSEVLLKMLLQESNNNQELIELLCGFVMKVKHTCSCGSTDRRDIISIIALNDLCLRLGCYALSSELLNHSIRSFPRNFLLAYNAAIKPIAGQHLLLKLWHILDGIIDSPFAGCQLIWRLKTPASAFGTVIKTFINAGNNRHGISPEYGFDAAQALLSKHGTTQEACHQYYNALIYDHLAATLIVKDEAGEYEDLLSDLPLPKGWNIRAAEHNPRRSYHHRLWTLIEAPVNEHELFTFELMIKRETDFYIGRSYQWGEKNCSIARTSSPWSQDGSFDRSLALQRWYKSKSILSMLSSEVREWHTQIN